MLRAVAIWVVLVVPAAAAAQRPETVAQALAACRQTPAPSAVRFRPGERQVYGLADTAPRPPGVTDGELAVDGALLRSLAQADPRRGDVALRVATDWMVRAHEPGDSAAAYREAARVLAELARDQPHYSRLDESLYREAHALQMAGDMSAARRAFFELIRGFPQSAWVPYAYLAFGEYYFGEADLAVAQEFYRKVLDLPASPPGLVALAHYRLAWVLHDLRDRRGARESFGKVLALAATAPGDLDVAATVAAVRVEICLP